MSAKQHSVETVLDAGTRPSAFGPKPTGAALLLDPCDERWHEPRERDFPPNRWWCFTRGVGTTLHLFPICAASTSSRSTLSVDDAPAEQDLVAAKHRDLQLAFALLLKCYGRFPRGRAELHDDAVEFVARQLGVYAGSLGFYEWTGRTIKRHRAEIRAHHGFRECTVADAEDLTGWLAGDYAQQERRDELVRDALLGECRARSVESPTPDRVERIVRSGTHQAERALAERVAGRLPVEVQARLPVLVQAPDTDVDEADPSVLALIRAATGNVSLSSTLTEISRLEAVRAVGLPAGLLTDVTPKVLAAWRARAAEPPGQPPGGDAPFVVLAQRVRLEDDLDRHQPTLLFVAVPHFFGRAGRPSIPVQRAGRRASTRSMISV